MKKDTLTSLLDFFAGLFVGIALACGGLCFFIFSDLGLVVALFFSLFVFGLFSFFALLAKSMAALLKESRQSRI
ncbi:hypothetical protein [Helicobacter ailurogastricus]|uniref:Integral membrane protein n=1 Tax=Helicobacter ailurogastricus TaxID=1578720 RepID=A0A0K2Y5F4_9HELI|nr:hypothetical protein [Helicobacter ailurogastricus]CRF40901.1 hypothetical protein HAL011_06700 [Helicobacter ailurogastricus]CRF42126.1 hypothetical protein HAL013_02830 [Helicobacter ailurogastricus]CRF44692.1 hypothetical protein HAL09_12950 [Helicobacter ailurogastricus]CRI32226.1 hypothetical protein HAL07_07010 [Helicobacter ailurogastricus]BDQ28701.1 hypothetical protein ASB7_05380 [Helicobacter ailurogastricus]